MKKYYFVYGLSTSLGAVLLAADKEGNKSSSFFAFGRHKKKSPEEMAASVLPMHAGPAKEQPVCEERITVADWIKNIALPNVTFRLFPKEEDDNMVLDIYTDEKRLALLTIEKPDRENSPLYKELVHMGGFMTNHVPSRYLPLKVEAAHDVDFESMGTPSAVHDITYRT